VASVLNVVKCMVPKMTIKRMRSGCSVIAVSLGTTKVVQRIVAFWMICFSHVKAVLNFIVSYPNDTIADYSSFFRAKLLIIF